MEYPSEIPQWIAALIGALMMASLSIYWFLFRSAVEEGKVPVTDFGLPDLMAGTVFFTWFVGASIRNISAPARVVSQTDLLGGGTLYFLIILAICGFLKLRKINPTKLFGIHQEPIWKVILLALGLLLAIFPLLGAAGMLSRHWLGPDAEPQEIVKFFQNAVKQGDSPSVLITVLIGGVLAPLAEELIFRGYLYGLCKRYLGIIAGIILNSALFAAAHGNLAALPSLAVLAIALTLAYEITGSLLVPITMHAIFNFTMFSVMLNNSTP